MFARSYLGVLVVFGGVLVACHAKPESTRPSTEAGMGRGESSGEAPAVFIEAPRDPALVAEAPGSEQTEPEPEPTVDPVLEQAAKLHFEAGTEHFAAGDYASALAQFEKAHALLPLPALRYNIAHCHEELGHIVEACASYMDLATGDEEYIRDAAKQSLARMGC